MKNATENQRKRKTIPAKHLGYLILFCLALLVVLTWLERVDQNESRKNQPPVPLAPVAVEVMSVQIGPVQEWIVGEGTAQALRKRHLRFEEAGKVVFLAKENDNTAIREGSAVRGPKSDQGQLLARIDTRDQLSNITRSESELMAARRWVEVARANLSQATNELTEAKASFERKKQLFEKKFLSHSDYEQARTQFHNAQDALETAKARLAAAQSKVRGANTGLDMANRGRERTELHAPFDGLIARINIKEGDYFDPANVDHSSEAKLLETSPITIIDPSVMEVTLYLPVFEGRLVKVGQKAHVVPGATDWFEETTSQDNNILYGEVHSVSPQLDTTRRAVRVKIRIHQQQEILDGMFVSCWIMVRVNENSLRVPIKSLLFKDNAPYVFVVRDGKAKKQRVELGIVDENNAEIISGVELGEQIVLKGRHQLSDGLPVNIINQVDDSNATTIQ